MKDIMGKAVRGTGWLVFVLALGCGGVGSLTPPTDQDQVVDELSDDSDEDSATGDGEQDGASSSDDDGDNGSGDDPTGDGDHGDGDAGDGDGDEQGDGDLGDGDEPGDGDGDASNDAGVEPGDGDGDSSSYAHLVEDAFDDFDTDTWSCEYTCPTVSEGHASFRLQAGIAPDNEGSWSKIGYKPMRFTSGRFTVRFALTARPGQKVWWGTALWDDGANPDGSEFNEINFGYTTNQSFSNTQLLFESARRGNFDSVKVDVGTDLYDGSYHTATLEYDASHVAFYFDDELMHTITDPDVIPTDPMKFIIGPRLVTGSSGLERDFTETVDWTQIEW
jgi:hypothetical protein